MTVPHQLPPSTRPPPLTRRPPARRYGIGTVVGAAVGAGLLAGVMGLGTGVLATYLVVTRAGGVDDGVSARTASTVLPERLPTLVTWVQERMGVPFAANPTVEVLDDDAFDGAFAATSPAAGVPQSLPQDDYATTVHALGLVPDPADYQDYYGPEGEGGAAGVVGFYDSDRQQLFVRGTRWTPLVEVTVVHELVHALQDQVADLDTLTAATRVEDETYLALSAVREGQATVVEEDWVAEQPQDYAEDYWGEMEEGSGGEPVDAFADTMSWLPYDLGWLAVLGLEEGADPAATLEVLADPPTTTEQLYGLGDWHEGDPGLLDPVAVPEPAVPPGGDVVDRGTLGVFVLGLMGTEREDWVMAGEENAVHGWAGDRYVTWTLQEQDCTRVVVQLDDEGAAGDLVRHLEGWARDGRTAAADGPVVTIDACVARS